MKFSHVLAICGLSIVGTSAMAGSTSSVGPANPAAVLCLELKGELESFTDAVGNQYGICAFDNARISDWTLFLARNGHNQQAVNAFLAHPALINSSNGNGSIGMPNPSSQYCLQVGGENVSAFSSEGEWGMCEFPDGSAIDGWTLFRGPTVHNRLANVLWTTPL
jgi:putative hemolysin